MLPLSLEKVLKMTDGYKSYLIAAAVAVVVFANLAGFLTQDQFEMILALLGAGGLASMRAAVAKVEEDVK